MVIRTGDDETLTIVLPYIFIPGTGIGNDSIYSHLSHDSREV